MPISTETFASEGFRTLFAVLHAELGDDYFATIRQHLKELKSQHGVLISVQLGEGNKGANYVLRRENPPEGSRMARMFAHTAAGHIPSGWPTVTRAVLGRSRN